jgi:hypothetical protein
MWLKMPLVAANDELLRLVNLGYEVAATLEDDGIERLRSGAISEAQAVQEARSVWGGWLAYVAQSLSVIFPSEREMHLLRRVVRRTPDDNGSAFGEFFAEIDRFDRLIDLVDHLRLTGLRTYSGAPPSEDRLFVEHIDSFARVRDVNPKMVIDLLDRNGRINLLEDVVQRALEQILDVPYHRQDHPTELSDLYTTNTVVNGRRTPTAFMLKGRGCTSRELQIRDCGKNGDQLLRLFDSPAELLVVQYVGMIADNVIRDLEQKVDARRKHRPTWFAIIDGQDTARLLRAYGFARSDRALLERQPSAEDEA